MDSQVQIVGRSTPKTWDDYEQGCLMTFGGGYRNEGHLEAFQHGMRTVFNLLRAEFPPAEVCMAAKQSKGAEMKPMERDFISGQLESTREYREMCSADTETRIVRIAVADTEVPVEAVRRWREPMPPSDLDSGVWFRAGCSGLWYKNPAAAGSIVEVRVDGVRFVPVCLEAQDDETA
jgi:hypothetical protein